MENENQQYAAVDNPFQELGFAASILKSQQEVKEDIHGKNAQKDVKPRSNSPERNHFMVKSGIEDKCGQRQD